MGNCQARFCEEGEPVMAQTYSTIQSNSKWQHEAGAKSSAVNAEKLLKHRGISSQSNANQSRKSYGRD